MATKRYCAFWYPSVFHQTGLNVAERIHEISHKDISDNVPTTSYRLFLDITESHRGDLIFKTYTEFPLGGGGARSYKDELTLKFETQSNNGFVVYSYENDKVDFDDYIYSSTFYHYAKSLRHCHEINHDSDSGLSAMSDKECSFLPRDIFKQDNVVLRYYLKQYERLFAEHYAKYLSTRSAFYDKVIRVVDKFRNYLSSNGAISLSERDWQRIELSINAIIKEINGINQDLLGRSIGLSKVRGEAECRRAMKKILKKRGRICHLLLQNILQLCDNAEVEYTYCKTLLESKYNTETKHDVLFDKFEVDALSRRSNASIRGNLLRRDESRKIANNIRNAMRYIGCIRDKCNNRIYELVDTVLDSSDNLARKAYLWAWVFGVATVVSLVLAIVK